MTQYKFREDHWMNEVRDYIDGTYKNHHYSKNNIQTTEFISDSGHLIGFAVGNIIKYAQRYGHKGTDDDARKDVLKIIHYAMILLDEHDKKVAHDYEVSAIDNGRERYDWNWLSKLDAHDENVPF